MGYSPKPDTLLVSHQAARRVEELRVAAVDVSSDGAFLYLEKENHRHTGIYGLASLPSSETLRVLDLTSHQVYPDGCLPTPTAGDVAAKALLDAAPELTTVPLESLFFLLPPDFQQTTAEAAAQAEPLVPVLRLSFQAVTTLVLSLCGKESGDRRRGNSSWAIEIDAPRLQSFKYKALMRRFRLRPAAAPGVVRVVLHFLRDYNKDDDKETRRVLFWQFLHNFTNARTLKLKVGNDLKDIAAIGEARHARLLQCAFPSLERLELEGMHRPKIKTAAVAIANLLHCCPALGEIMLKLSNTVTALPDKDPRYGREFLERKDRLDCNKSIDRFVRRKGSKTALDCVLEDVPDIPGLSGRSFACLQRTLGRVSMQFRLDNNSISSCLGLRLIKFFTDHASVLEEICVDTGNRRLNEHLNFNMATQMALAPIPISATASCIQNKNLADSSSEFSRNHSASLDPTKDLARSTVSFRVLPLQRQTRMDCKSQTKIRDVSYSDPRYHE
ncbi:unnamed protein product [Miscanthus lutarioriparius]|uniref:Uncharacterized protein n=1 Tax=Miscanthus lutarioriparius TaxID=422564 RepID=A0A811S712_9POAL|nr:unnamed protein product [Miscanthus lutarioriparius]